MAVVELIGVVESGGPQDWNTVPANPRRAVRCTLGSTVTIRLAVVERTGVAVDLSTATLIFTVKKAPNAYDITFATNGVVVGDPLTGHAEFSIPATAFEYIEPGRYAFDIWLLRGAERDPVIPTSPFIIEPTVRAVS